MPKPVRQMSTQSKSRASGFDKDYSCALTSIALSAAA